MTPPEDPFRLEDEDEEAVRRGKREGTEEDGGAKRVEPPASPGPAPGSTDRSFGLEEEAPAPEKAEALPVAPVTGPGGEPPPSSPPVDEAWFPVGGDSPEGPEPAIDERTVAEREGRALPRTVGLRPLPPEWPIEAFSFPFRAGHGTAVAGAVLFWVVVDVLGWVNIFLGAVLKVAAYAWFVRWQLHVAATSSSGHDQPGRWADVVDFDAGRLRQLSRFVLTAVVLVTPGAVFLALGRDLAGWVLLAGGGTWLAVAALGECLGEPGLVWPWRGIPWLLSRPLALVAASIGWWVAVAVEQIEVAKRPSNLVAAIVAFLFLRACFVYAWLLSARALGVVGRQPPPGEG